MFAQSMNADAREPVFTTSVVSDHFMHNGGICNQGLLCQLTTGGDRSLADFFQVAIGPDGLANVIFADNGTGSTHATFARQTSGPVALTNPTFPTCIAPATITPVSAVSRKIHGAAGTFNLPLALVGTPTIEPRSGGTNGDYQMVVTFAAPVAGVSGAYVTSGTGTASVSNVSGSTVTVDLTGVTNAQTITVTLTDVQTGASTGNAAVPMSVLIGDIDANANVSGSDVNLCKALVGGSINSGTNFRRDVDADGNVSGSDVNITKSKVGTHL